MTRRITATRWIKTKLGTLVYGKRLSIVPASLRANWPQRMFLKQLLGDLAIDCVLDVGANGGQYGSELRRIGYRGVIVSFEPDPRAFALLCHRSADDPRWHCRNLALGRTPGSAPFHIMAVSLFNSFQTPSTDETNRFAGANDIARTVTVEVARLTDLLPEIKYDHKVDKILLKMDTQGFDHEVFAGAKGVWHSLAALQSEIGIKRLYEGVPYWTDQIAAYQAAGFNLTGLYAVNPGEGDLLEIDCYFRRAPPP